METRRITWWALGALLVGLLAGAFMARAQFAGLEGVLSVLEPIGSVWINAVRMTIIPLVVSLLIVAVASSGSLRSMGRLGGAALVFFITSLGVVAVIAAVLAPAMLSGLVIDPAASAALRETATSNAQQVSATVRGMGGLAQRVVELVPPNPIRAAADASLLPLVVFSLIFGAALSRLPASQRDPVVGMLRGISEAMIVIIRWVFVAAPAGVFALAMTVGARLGFDAIRAAGWYVATFASTIVVATIVAYIAAVLLGRVSLRTFAVAAAPAQVIGLGSRSSSAALPAMIDSARDVLKLPEPIVNFVLPMAVAMFRFTVPVSYVLGALFLGRLYGVEISATAVASVALLSVLMSFSVPPVPSGSLFVMAPALADLGIPVEGIAILIALDAIPDLFKTLSNVTGNLVSAVVVARLAT